MEAAKLSVQNISYKSGHTFLCKDINFEINEGEQWVIFGENGSGKTTLLSLLGGYRRPYKGEIAYKGSTYTETNVTSLRQKVSLISSSYFDNCFRHETALEIVVLGLNGPESGDII